MEGQIIEVLLYTRTGIVLIMGRSTVYVTHITMQIFQTA